MDAQTEPEICCPYCGEALDCLSYVSAATHYYDVSLLNGDLDYAEEDTTYWDDDERNFRCPQCDEIIADNEADAEVFLKTGNIPSEGDEALASPAVEVQTP